MPTRAAQAPTPARRCKAGELRLEVVVMPVSDVDRAKGFYAGLGLAARRGLRSPSEDFRIVQLTPPGSGCSIQFGTNVTLGRARFGRRACTWSSSDIEAARDELIAHGVEVSEVFHEGAPGRSLPATTRARVSRAAARPRQLRLVRHVQRSRTATAGCCRRSRRGCPAAVEPADHVVRVRRGPGERAPARGGRARRAREAHAARPTRTGRTGTPSTWCASRPARSCRR